ncbi:hypothetical protein [Clostridium botulinum]|nr:hypothetical protein [Clostridium botulinum]
MKPGMAAPMGRKFLMELNLELLSEISRFISVFYIFMVLKLSLLYLL